MLQPPRRESRLGIIINHETNYRMPTRKTITKQGTRNVLINSSFERNVACWLMHDGWEVYRPELDNGHKTDILISDGPNFYRLQVKTCEAKGENHRLENLWKDSHLDIVIAFARNSNWGYVLPAFKVNNRRLNYEGHERFQQTRKSFLNAFHRLELQAI